MFIIHNNIYDILCTFVIYSDPINLPLPIVVPHANSAKLTKNVPFSSHIQNN